MTERKCFVHNKEKQLLKPKPHIYQSRKAVAHYPALVSHQFK